MDRNGPPLSMQQLVEMTTVKRCTKCRLRHAPVRTCDEARLAATYDESVYPYGRCDTCGEPCDEGGCTLDREHETSGI